MKKILVSFLLLTTIAFSPLLTNLSAQDIQPLVSTEWLGINIDRPNMVLLDVRDTGSYARGHIPGSINVPAYPNWYINDAMSSELPWMEIPGKENLFATLGQAGIMPNSMVVVIAQTSDSPSGMPAAYHLVRASRALLALLYAGIETVTFLNGGYDKWKAEDRTVTPEAVAAKPVTYTGKVNNSIFVNKEYVESKLGKTIIMDTRSPNNYYGTETDISAKKQGHIPTAINLPAPWFWENAKSDNGELTYLVFKDDSEIKEIALAVLGEDMDAEIIDYCGVGGYASPVWFLLTRVAGYTNVKFYDGSMQEWTTDPNAPLTKYRYR